MRPIFPCAPCKVVSLIGPTTTARLQLTDQVHRRQELRLDCRACGTACRSGVQYGKLIEPFRAAIKQDEAAPRKTDGWFHRSILFGLFPYLGRLRAAHPMDVLDCSYRGKPLPLSQSSRSSLVAEKLIDRATIGMIELL